MKIEIDLSKCKGDGVCTTVCPANVYELTNKQGKMKSCIRKDLINSAKQVKNKLQIRSDVCKGCRVCETRCPMKAIKISE